MNIKQQKTLHLPDRENAKRRFLVRNDPDAINLVNRIMDCEDRKVVPLSDREFMLLKSSVIIL